ncbi:MAG: guanylate kinase [Clostridia bacterium]|nr:guanylate kinase [Clostridia bacterium]
MSNGRLVIISGPSGSGKDTILKRVLEILPEIKFSISSITRPMRPGEVEGEKYNFVSKEYFEDMIKNDMLLEYNNYVGNYYGTPKAPVEKVINEGGEIILEIDVNGQKNVKSQVESSLSVFIMPPSVEVLRERLIGRGTDSAEVIEKRMKTAIFEMECAKNYDYIVINDDLEKAVEDFVTIIKADRMNIQRNNKIIDEVLGKC